MRSPSVLWCDSCDHSEYLCDNLLCLSQDNVLQPRVKNGVTHYRPIDVINRAFYSETGPFFTFFLCVCACVCVNLFPVVWSRFATTGGRLRNLVLYLFPFGPPCIFFLETHAPGNQGPLCAMFWYRYLLWGFVVYVYAMYAAQRA